MSEPQRGKQVASRNSRTVIVKLKEGGLLYEREEDGRLEAEHLNLDRFYEILHGASRDGGAAPIQARRSVAVDPKTLESLHDNAEAYHKRKVASVNLFITLVLPLDVTASDLCSQLMHEDDTGVECAYVRRPMRPASDTPDFSEMQLYLEPAPKGVDARHAWTVDGGRGHRTTVWIWEAGYDRLQEDLPSVTWASDEDLFEDELPGIDEAWIEHGTATLGVLGGKHDSLARGVMGICPDTTFRFGAICESPDEEFYQSLIEGMQAGDVLLIEMELESKTPGIYGPAELDPEIRSVVESVVGSGVVVVEAAGNSDRDLGEMRDELGVKVFDPDHPDTGAVIVGAGNSVEHPSRPPRTKRDSSNFGDRVNCQGLGDHVFSTGNGSYYNGGDHRLYTYASYNSTSSASAILAGLLGCLLSARMEAANGAAPDPRDVRDWLANPENGLPQENGTYTNPESHPIGPLPDLKKLLCVQPQMPDLLIRDTLSELGIDFRRPHMQCRSPDIVVVGALVTDPEDAFDGTLSQGPYPKSQPVPGQDNFVCVRVRNEGSAPAEASVCAYWSEPASYLHPATWRQIGSRLNLELEPGDCKVAGPFVWENNLVPENHGCCLAAVADCAGSPAPALPDNMPATVYAQAVSSSDNIALKNVQRLRDRGTGVSDPVTFILRGLARMTAHHTIKIHHHLPRETEIRIEQLGGPPGDDTSVVDARSHRAGVSPLEFRVRLDRQEQRWMRLSLRTPTSYRPGLYGLTIGQRYAGHPLGQLNMWLG